jgi:hypothetical protein
MVLYQSLYDMELEETGNCVSVVVRRRGFTSKDWLGVCATCVISPEGLFPISGWSFSRVVHPAISSAHNAQQTRGKWRNYLDRLRGKDNGRTLLQEFRSIRPQTGNVDSPPPLNKLTRFGPLDLEFSLEINLAPAKVCHLGLNHRYYFY